MEYAHWVDEHQHLLNDLRLAVNSQMSDDELHILVEGVRVHHNELFRLKRIGAKADIFHILNGTWKTPVERRFMWLGGFRSSELLKVIDPFSFFISYVSKYFFVQFHLLSFEIQIIKNHLEPLTEQQLLGICNLEKSSVQSEDALDKGMEALQQYLVETLSSNSLGPTGNGNVADYMDQMALAMAKLGELEGLLQQVRHKISPST